MENIFIFNYICAYIYFFNYFINISVVYYVTLLSFTHCSFPLSFSG